MNPIGEAEINEKDIPYFSDLNSLIAMKKLEITKINKNKILIPAQDKIQTNVPLKYDINQANVIKNSAQVDVKGGNIFFGGNIRTSVLNNENNQAKKSNIFSNSIIKNCERSSSNPPNIAKGTNFAQQLDRAKRLQLSKAGRDKSEIFGNTQSKLIPPKQTSGEDDIKVEVIENTESPVKESKGICMPEEATNKIPMYGSPSPLKEKIIEIKGTNQNPLYTKPTDSESNNSINVSNQRKLNEDLMLNIGNSDTKSRRIKKQIEYKKMLDDQQAKKIKILKSSEPGIRPQTTTTTFRIQLNKNKNMQFEGQPNNIFFGNQNQPNREKFKLQSQACEEHNEGNNIENQMEPFSKISHAMPDPMETNFTNPGINIFKRGQSNQIPRKSEPIKPGIYDTESRSSALPDKQKYRMELDRQVQEKIERNKSTNQNEQNQLEYRNQGDYTSHHPTVNNFTPPCYGSLPIGSENNQYELNHNYSRFKENLLDSDSKMRRVSEFRKKQFLQQELKKQIDEKDKNNQSEEDDEKKQVEFHDSAKRHQSQQSFNQLENNYSFDNREAASSFKFKRNEYFETSFGNPLLIPQKSIPKPATEWIHANREIASNIKCCPENILPIPLTFIKPKKAQSIKVHMPINATLSNEGQFNADHSSSFNDSYEREEDDIDREEPQNEDKGDFKLRLEEEAVSIVRNIKEDFLNDFEQMKLSLDDTTCFFDMET